MLQSPPLASPALFGDTMKMALAQLYCVCRQPYDANRFMIECDICKDWFHGSCVKVEEHHAMDIDVYHCPNCDGLHGPSVMKKRNNWHRHDYTEPDDGTKPVQAGTSVFIRELQARTFASGDEILVQMQGSQVTQKYLEREGFHHPIVVFDKEGLGLRVPPPSFSVEDVQRFVGGDKIIDVIDVARQADSKMKLSEFVKYYYRPVRPKVLNVISLEFSDTKMADLVVVPELAQKMSWVEKYWPDDSYFPKPFVQKYCLMGVKDSYTDFHIDFGGTSVWYHVLWGEKIFYLIEPTEANLALYEAWSSSPKQSEVFFGEKVEKCHKCVVQQGTTVLIPTGWIHAVLTSQDCMAFGGNFLHNLNIGMQLRCYEMERRLKTPDLFKFPYFEAICWYVAKNLLEKLRELREDNSQPKAYLVDGVKALITALKNWLRREVNEPTSEVPDHIRPYYLIKELAKEIRHLGEDQSTTGVKTMKSQGHAENPLMLSASERVSQERRAARKLQDHHHQHHHTPKVHSNLDILERHTQEVLKRLEAGPLDEDLPFSSKVNGKFNKVCTASAAAVERSHKNNLRLMLCNGHIIRDGRHRVMRRNPLKLERHWTSLSQQKESKTERAAMGLMENCTAGDEKSTNHDSRDIQPDPRQRATERLAVSDVESDSTSRKEENDSSEEDSRRSEDERPEDERPHENDKRSGKGMQRHAGRQHSQNRRALKRERPTSPSTEEAIQGMLSMAGLLCPPAPEDGGHTQEPWWSTRSLVSPESTRGHQRPGHQQGRFMDSQGNSSSEAWDSHELPSSPHSPMRPDASPGQDYPYRESSLSPPLHPSKRHASNPAPITNQATKGKRPKKGTVTAKQRLGKILKLSHHSQLFV